MFCKILTVVDPMSTGRFSVIMFGFGLVLKISGRLLKPFHIWSFEFFSSIFAEHSKVGQFFLPHSSCSLVNKLTVIAWTLLHSTCWKVLIPAIVQVRTLRMRITSPISSSIVCQYCLHHTKMSISASPIPRDEDCSYDLTITRNVASG